MTTLYSCKPDHTLTLSLFNTHVQDTHTHRQQFILRTILIVSPLRTLKLVRIANVCGVPTVVRLRLSLTCAHVWGGRVEMDKQQGHTDH